MMMAMPVPSVYISYGGFATDGEAVAVGDAAGAGPTETAVVDNELP